MKKITVTSFNISDIQFEKMRFEAIHEQKDIKQVIIDRLFYKPFHPEVEEAYENWIENNINKIMNDK